ncbi:MAG: SPOR domain-containing protein [Ghiorsea sp.]
MTGKDFAHLETTQFDSSKDTPVSNSKALLIVILAIMFAIVCFAIGFFMGEKHGLETDKGNKHEALLETLQEQQKELESFKQEAEKWRQKEASTSQVGELTFYNELPKQSVMPEPLDGKIKHQIITPKNKHSIIDESVDNIEATEKKLNAIIEKEMNTSTRKFRIQLASFKQRSDSENLVAQLKAVGVDASVDQVNLANIGVRYRVNTLPFDQHHHALRAKRLVKEKFNITGIIIAE